MKSMTYSNVTAERRSLIDLSLRPLMTCITQRLRTWFNRNPTQYQKNETDHLVEYVNKQLGL